MKGLMDPVCILTTFRKISKEAVKETTFSLIS